MTSAVIGALRVTLGLNSAQFTSGLTAAQQQLQQTSSRFSAIGTKIAGIGAAMSLAFTTPFIAAGVHLLQGSQDAAAASAQVQAALTSMGDASGKTLEGLQATAEGLRNLTGVDDDEILKSVTANLLTFGNVSGDVFDRAQASIVDISARLGSDLQSATMMVGKALNDPIKGLGALRKTGIQFTEQQQQQIIAMTEVGNVAGAQAMMLAELERQFGGAAKAAADADIWTPMKTAMMDLEGAFEPLIRSVVAPAITAIAGLTKTFASLPPSMIGIVAVSAAVVAALGPILVGAGAVVTAIGAIGTAIAAGGMVAAIASFAVAAAPFVAAAVAIGAAVYAFRDDLAPILSAFGKSISDAIGPSIPPMMAAARTAFTAFMDTMSALFAIVGPILAALGKQFIVSFGPVLAGVLRLLGATLTSVFDVVGQTLRVIGALLRGDWSGAWNAAGSLVMSVVRSLGRLVEAIFPGILGHVRRMVDGVREWFTAQLARTLTPTRSKAPGDNAGGLFHFGVRSAADFPLYFSRGQGDLLVHREEEPFAGKVIDSRDFLVGEAGPAPLQDRQVVHQPRDRGVVQLLEELQRDASTLAQPTDGVDELAQTVAASRPGRLLVWRLIQPGHDALDFALLSFGVAYFTLARGRDEEPRHQPRDDQKNKTHDVTPQ